MPVAFALYTWLGGRMMTPSSSRAKMWLRASRKNSSIQPSDAADPVRCATFARADGSRQCAPPETHAEWQAEWHAEWHAEWQAWWHAEWQALWHAE